MIGELVEFNVPEGTTAEEILEEARRSLKRWKGYPNLIRKHYLQGVGGVCGGFYLWENEEAAKEAHDQNWQNMVEKRTGSRPTFKYFAINMILDNIEGKVIENP